MISEGGLEIRFSAPVTGQTLRLGLGSGDEYRISFLLEGQVLAEAEARTAPRIPAQSVERGIPIPDAAPEFDRVRIDRGSASRDFLWSFGFIAVE